MVGSVVLSVEGVPLWLCVRLSEHWPHGTNVEARVDGLSLAFYGILVLGYGICQERSMAFYYVPLFPCFTYR